MSTLGVVTDAMAEAAAGQYPAREAASVLWPLYLATVTTGTSNGRILTDREARHQVAGILAWAVGQAPAGAARAAERVRERLPQPVTEVDAAEFAAWNASAKTCNNASILPKPKLSFAFQGSGLLLPFYSGVVQALQDRCA